MTWWTTKNLITVFRDIQTSILALVTTKTGASRVVYDKNCSTLYAAPAIPMSTLGGIIQNVNACQNFLHVNVLQIIIMLAFFYLKSTLPRSCPEIAPSLYWSFLRSPSPWGCPQRRRDRQVFAHNLTKSCTEVTTMSSWGCQRLHQYLGFWNSTVSYKAPKQVNLLIQETVECKSQSEKFQQSGFADAWGLH